MATKMGVIKKTAIAAYEAIRRSGIIAIKLSSDDQLRWAKLTTGDDIVFLISKHGMSIKFDEKNVRPMARDTMGVRGIKLKKDDELIGMDVINKEDIKAQLLVVTEKGIGKKSEVSAWPLQLRGGVGVKAANLGEKTGSIVTAQMLTKEDEALIITSQKGQVIRVTLKGIPKLTRDTQGVIIMRLSQTDKVAAATIIKTKKEDEIPQGEKKPPQTNLPTYTQKPKPKITIKPKVAKAKTLKTKIVKKVIKAKPKAKVAKKTKKR